MNALKICKRDVTVCERDLSVTDAALLMRSSHMGAVVVIDRTNGGRRVTGMLTDRDIVVAVVAAKQDPVRLCVGDIMTSQPVTAAAWEDEWHLMRRMRLHGFRRLPVVDDNKDLIGIVALDDLLRFSAAFLSELGEVGMRETFIEQETRS